MPVATSVVKLEQDKPAERRAKRVPVGLGQVKGRLPALPEADELAAVLNGQVPVVRLLAGDTDQAIGLGIAQEGWLVVQIRHQLTAAGALGQPLQVQGQDTQQEWVLAITRGSHQWVQADAGQDWSGYEVPQCHLQVIGLVYSMVVCCRGCL